MNKKVAIIFFRNHIGGMTTPGLGAKGVGKKHVIGGLARKSILSPFAIPYRTITPKHSE